MSGIRHSVVEADETYDPRNDGLDAFSNFVRMLKAQGCESQLRARFDALVAPAPRTVESQAADDEPADMLELRLLIDACKRGAKFAWPDSLHNARKRIQAGAEVALAKALKERRASA